MNHENDLQHLGHLAKAIDLARSLSDEDRKFLRRQIAQHDRQVESKLKAATVAPLLPDELRARLHRDLDGLIVAYVRQKQARKTLCLDEAFFQRLTELFRRAHCDAFDQVGKRYGIDVDLAEKKEVH